MFGARVRHAPCSWAPHQNYKLAHAWFHSILQSGMEGWAGRVSDTIVGIRPEGNNSYVRIASVAWEMSELGGYPSPESKQIQGPGAQPVTGSSL